MNITCQQLKQVYPLALVSRINIFLPFFNKYFDHYQVSTTLRCSAFLAQVGHESGQLRYTEEIATGEAYEGRENIGNIFPGDGKKFKGRGLIQITGRANYTEISSDFDVDFIRHPERLTEPEWAVRSAFWFWDKRKLNILADSMNIRQITKIVNGGYNGYNERCQLYEIAKKIIR